jgi:arylsulfatase A-like enzyme
MKKICLLLFSLYSFMIFGQPQKKPNVIVILVDDMGWSDIGCYGGEIPTPNIDKIAKKGVRFKQFYNTGRCCPTRASLLTGLYAHKAGIGHMAEDPEAPDKVRWGTAGYQGFLNKNSVTLAEILKTNGYNTYMAGKWHVGIDGKEKWPLQRGFDRYYGHLAGAVSYFKPQGLRGLYLDNQAIPTPTDPNYYTTDAFTDYGLQFIKEQKKENPYFLYLAYNAPHWPLHAKPEDIAKFKNTYAKGWDKIRQERLAKQTSMGLLDANWGISARDSRVRPWKKLSKLEQDSVAYRMAVYAAQVHAVDYNVGKLIDYLEKTKTLENTVILFMSDNGACAENYDELGSKDFNLINDPNFYGAVSYGIGWANASNTPYYEYKVKPYEGGISSPMIALIPKNAKMKGKISNEVGHIIDIVPTILDITGTQYPKKFHADNEIYPLAGISLLSVISKNQKLEREYLFWEHQDFCAVRKGDFKAVKKIAESNWQLFDLKNDRVEHHNIADKHPELLLEMNGKWNEWALENNVLPKKLTK